jgi:hypothetical protein
LPFASLLPLTELLLKLRCKALIFLLFLLARFFLSNTLFLQLPQLISHPCHLFRFLGFAEPEPPKNVQPIPFIDSLSSGFSGTSEPYSANPSFWSKFLFLFRGLQLTPWMCFFCQTLRDFQDLKNWIHPTLTRSPPKKIVDFFAYGLSTSHNCGPKITVFFMEL